MSKNCVITGGSKGIGLATANRFAAEGWNVIISARTESKLEEAAAQMRREYPESQILICPADVRSKDSLRSLVRFAEARWDRVDVLVNNAGSFTPGSVLTEEEGSLEFMMETNTYSAYYLTRYLFPLIEKSKAAHIFNMCSIAGMGAYPNGGSYGISKYAMLGYSKNLREELKPKGIKVTTVLPGATWTASWEGSGIPRERIMESEDIAEAVMSALRMGPRAVVEDIVIRPQLGDL